MNPDFKGEWYSEPVMGTSGVMIEEYFIIDEETAFFGEWCELIPTGSNCYNRFTDAEINSKGSKITFGTSIKLPGKITLNIDALPHINSDGKWECTLTEKVFTKI